MATIDLITYDQKMVTPKDDALIHQFGISNGVLYGCEVTLANSNTLHITGGQGVIYGRQWEIAEGDITVTLPDLTDDDQINVDNSVSELELCTFDVSSLTISNLERTVEQVADGDHQDVVDLQADVSEIKSNLTDLKTLEFRSYLIGGNYQEDEYNILCVYNEHLKHVQIDVHPRTVGGSWSETVAKGNYVLTRVPFIPRYTTYIPINRTDDSNVCAVLKIRKTEYNNQNIGEISVELLDSNTPKGVQLCTHLEFYYDDDSIIPSQS